MASTEVRNLPLGNEWEFSKKNYTLGLQPGTGIEITQPPSQLQELIQHVQARFIREEWQFNSVVGAFQRINEGSPELFVIFTHPSRFTLVGERLDDIDQFIKPEVIEAYSRATASTNRDVFYGVQIPLADNPINRILRGTNLVTSSIMGAYNVICSEEGRLFRQTGVGYFNIDLQTIKQRVSEQDRQIEELMVHIRPLQKERAILLDLQSPNPIQLFTR